MFLKLLTPIIVWVYDTYFWHKDYEIVNRSLEYTIDPHAKYIISSDFWIGEEKYWSRDITEHFVDITNVDLSHHLIPANVIKCLIHVKYYYRNRIYKYISNNFDYIWPPPNSSDMSFSMPIVRAVLMDHAATQKIDVTKKIKRFAGPKNNFYNKDILIRDMFSFTTDTLEEEYPYIVISDIMNNVKAYKTSGYIRPQTSTLVAR
ncbi:hypothetical protein [Dishui Lake phycodnavirus 4]|nr:hypothetical protein [Dishui Lake phycodnavirus 4]